jgi:hypothetical protein
MRPEAEHQQLLAAISQYLLPFPGNLYHTVLSSSVNSKQSSKQEQMAGRDTVTRSTAIHTGQEQIAVSSPGQTSKVRNNKDHKHDVHIHTAAHRNSGNRH